MVVVYHVVLAAQTQSIIDRLAEASHSTLHPAGIRQ